MKKLLSGLLSLVMVFSLTPSTIVFADDEKTDTIPQSQEENETTGSGTESVDVSEEIGGGRNDL